MLDIRLNRYLPPFSMSPKYNGCFLLPHTDQVLRTALEPLAETFMDLILEDQNCFESKEGWQELLHLIPDKAIANELRESWSDSEKSSSEKWSELRSLVKAIPKTKPQRVRTVESSIRTEPHRITILLRQL